MADFGKETGDYPWLCDTFVLFPSKWSCSSASDSFKGTSFYLKIVKRE